MWFSVFSLESEWKQFKSKEFFDILSLFTCQQKLTRTLEISKYECDGVYIAFCVHVKNK